MAGGWNDVELCSLRVISLEDNLFHQRGLEVDALPVVGINLVRGESREVLGSQHFLVCLVIKLEGGLAGELPAHRVVLVQVQPVAVMIPDGIDEGGRPPRDEIFAFRAEAIHGNFARSAHIRAQGRARDGPADVDGPFHGFGGNEAGQRIEARAEIVVFGVAVERPAIEARLRFVCRPRAARPARQGRGAGHGLRRHPPVLVQLEAAIHPAHAVEGSGEFAVRVNQPDCGLPEDVAVHPQGGEEGSLAFQRISRRDGFSRRAVVGKERSNRVRTPLAGQAHAELRVGDVACEKQVQRRFKEAGVFQKERTLLRKVSLESPVHGNLRLVGFHLREVRIHRHIQREGLL